MNHNQLKLLFFMLFSIFFSTTFQAYNHPTNSQPAASQNSSRIATFVKKHDLLTLIGTITGITFIYRTFKAYEAKRTLAAMQLQAELEREQREQERRQQEHERETAEQQWRRQQATLEEERARQQREYDQQARLARERQQAEWEFRREQDERERIERERLRRQQEERDRQERERLRKQQEDQEQQDIRRRGRFWAKLGKQLSRKQESLKRQAPYVFLSEETRKVYEELNIPLHISPFEPLGVADNASRQDLIKAHRKLVPLVHPDRNKTPEANAQFRLLETCYQNCIDIKNRQGASHSF